ncbi:uncharacterized protein LOC144225840 isoform X4 [Crocuta crocuta]
MIRIKKDHEEMSQLRTSALRECRIPDVFPSNRALLLNSSYQLGTSLSGNRVCCLHQRLLDAPMEETMRHSKEGSKGRCGLSWSLQHEDPDNPLKADFTTLSSSTPRDDTATMLRTTKLAFQEQRSFGSQSPKWISAGSISTYGASLLLEVQGTLTFPAPRGHLPSLDVVLCLLRSQRCSIF